MIGATVTSSVFCALRLFGAFVVVIRIGLVCVSGFGLLVFPTRGRLAQRDVLRTRGKFFQHRIVDCEFAGRVILTCIGVRH